MIGRKHTVAAALVVSLAIAATATASARPASQSTSASSAGSATATRARSSHHFRGRVTSANRSHRWFRMRTTTHRSVRIYTNRATRWHDCDWGDMRSGHHVDVRAHRSNGHWVASRMQNWRHHDDWDDDWDMMR